MIERFNFYDIYGYLLPGTLLFGIFWFPFGLTVGALPTNQISSTVLLLVFAYIAGHLLQILGSVVISSKIPDRQKRLRAPSNILLDEESKFSAAFRADLAQKISNTFQIRNLEQDSDREAAFLESRAYLVRRGAASYLEQFEGMYAMMRGLVCAFSLGFAYLAGWGVSFYRKIQAVSLTAQCLLAAAVAGALIASWVLHFIAANPSPDKEEREQQQGHDQDASSFLAVCSMLFTAGIGFFLGAWKPMPANTELFVWSALPVTLFAAMRCLQAYRTYAQTFAETVWRDFAGFCGDQSAAGNGRYDAAD
jgi:hypothetical protein